MTCGQIKNALKARPTHGQLTKWTQPRGTIGDEFDEDGIFDWGGSEHYQAAIEIERQENAKARDSAASGSTNDVVKAETT